jgi:hypothetical protein
VSVVFDFFAPNYDFLIDLCQLEKKTAPDDVGMA